MIEHAAAENRQERRQRVLKGGTILTTIANSEVRCTIRNMSKTGAELKVGIDAGQAEIMKQMIPLGRPGTPEEAAGAVYLFCRSESDYISGEVIVAAGGLRM